MGANQNIFYFLCVYSVCVYSFLVCSLSTVLFLFLAAVSEVLFLPGCYAEYLLLIYIFNFMYMANK